MRKIGRSSFLRECVIGLTHLVALATVSVVLAACGGDDGTSTLAEAAPVTIEVTPASSVVPKGLTQQFKVVGTFSDSRKVDLSNTAVWQSRVPHVAAIDASGLATALTEGFTVLTATYFNGAVYLTASATLHVQPPVVQAIAITPNPAFAGIAVSVKLTAKGTHSDGTTADVSALATWTSDTASVATVERGTGMVSGVALGSSTISAAIGAVNATTPLAVIANAWSPTGSLLTERSNDQAFPLLDGRVLTVGGWDGPPSEIYDFLTQTWSPTGSLDLFYLDRGEATLLANGKVLMAGAWSTDLGIRYFATCRVYDPVSGAWSRTGGLDVRRVAHTLTPLLNGKVLAAGGSNDHGLLVSAELYDPNTATWTPTGNLTAKRGSARAVLLKSNKVLIVGGDSLNSAEIYDPDTGTWSLTGSPAVLRSNHTATLLPNGNVLVVGGSSDLRAELYDPLTGTWSFTGSLSTKRSNHTATLLSNGTVLVAGGSDGLTFHASVEIYDPLTGTSSPTGSLATPRASHTATLLPNGIVLVAGGRNSAGRQSTAELYWPAQQ